MLTLDERIIRQDCLSYLMERIDLPEPAIDSQRVFTPTGGLPWCVVGGPSDAPL